MTEAEQLLLKQASKGNAQAFEALILPHQSRIYGVCLRMMGNPDDAMDAVQETMIRTYMKLSTFKHEAQFSTWLYRIATNICLDMLRRRKRHDTVSMDALEDNGAWLPDAKENRPEESALRRDGKASVEAALMQLSPRHRLMLVLREVQGFSYEDIAKVTHTSLGTVKSRIFRARREMQMNLEKQELSDCIGVKESERSGMLL